MDDVHNFLTVLIMLTECNPILYRKFLYSLLLVNPSKLIVYEPMIPYMALNQKHWVCVRLGRPFRDIGL